MKVIKSKKQTDKWPKRCICEECGAELEYEPRDIYVGWMGVEYVTCPECGKETMIGDERKAKPTWPLTFHHTCKENGAVALQDENVAAAVDFIYNVLKNSNEKNRYAVHALGDTLVVGLKDDEAIELYVAKDYWEDTIFLD